MNEFDTDQSGADDSPSSNEPVTIGKKDLAQLRKAANAASARDQELAGLRRQMAFMQAGIDPADKKLSYFAKGYEGELDAEAIKAAAMEAGFLSEPAPQSQSGSDQYQYQGAYQQPNPEIEAMQRMNTVTQGNSGAQATADTMYRQALANAKTPAEAIEVMQKFGLAMPGAG